MATRSASPKRDTTAEAVVPPGLRDVLEANRLSLLALFRALDRLGLAQKIPPELRTLFELDADLAEALWVLDQPSRRFDMGAMTRDTLASLAALPEALQAFLQQLSAAAQAQLLSCMKAVRASLAPADAYLQIPGRDPTLG
jgi:hypothetical protein